MPLDTQKMPLDTQKMLAGLMEKNQDVRGITLKPDSSVQMQFNDGITEPAPTPAAPNMPSDFLSDLGMKLGNPATLNMLSTLAQAIDPEGSWSNRLGGAVKQKTTNELYYQLMQSMLQNQQGGASPFQQASQR